MGKSNPRQVALDCLSQWERPGARLHADQILADAARRARLEGPDRALAQNLFYGVLRHRTRLDVQIDQLRRGSLNPDTRRVLQLGFFQIFHAGIAEHAAVNETVSLARGLRGVVNGILRNALRQREKLENFADNQPLAISHSHPEFLVARWEKHFGAEAARKLCAWNNEPPPIYARVNRLVEAAENAIADSNDAAAVQGRPGFYRLVKGAPPATWLDEGWIYIQDPSTTASVDLLGPRRNETILDLCAAPGGKTALMADRMGNTGRILATDDSRERLEKLKENMRRLRVGIARAEAIDWIRPPKARLVNFPKCDGALADVPCSNTGVMRRRIDVRWRLQPDEFGRLAGQQVSMVAACLPLLKPNGRLVYSTCSLEPEENRGVVDRLLDRFPDRLILEEISESLPWRDGFDGAFAARFQIRKPK